MNTFITQKTVTLQARRVNPDGTKTLWHTRAAFIRENELVRIGQMEWTALLAKARRVRDDWISTHHEPFTEFRVHED